ncbi:MAG: lysophospholipid acyltransferase family protein [Giesbergeria sp.]
MQFFRHLFAAARLRFALLTLGVGCLLWTVLAFPLGLVLPRRWGMWVGRWMATLGFRLYIWLLGAIGLGRFDITALDALRGAGPLVLAVNHPGLLDALMVLSRLPNVTCIFKASLMRNPLWGAGARLAGYIRNDLFLGAVNLAVDELHRGSQLLLFPEGTRSDPMPLGEFQIGAAYVSYRSGIPIQTLIIEQDSRFLGKGWPWLKRPDMPMHFRIRLGQRFDPPTHPKAFTLALHDYFKSEVAPLSPVEPD